MQTILICFLIGAAVGFLVVGILAAQLRSVKAKNDAQSYIREGSFFLSHSRDTYLYSNVTRREKPSSNSKR